MALSEMDKERKMMDHVIGRIKIDGLDRKVLILLEASSHSLFHLKFSFFSIDKKNEKALSSAHKRNLDNAANRPVSC